MLIFFLKKEKRAGEEGKCKMLGFDVFRERVCNLSLGCWAIRPSDFFEPRRKVVLRSEDYAWALVSWSFDKLREVGVLSYLFNPLFKCFVMLVLV